MKCGACGGELKTVGTTHRYVGSGLSNVVLHDVAVRKCRKCGEEEVAIPNLSGLHRCIALLLVTRKSALLAAELRFLRQYLGRSSKDFAKILGVTAETLSRWENAKWDIPPVADRVVRLLVAHTPPQTDYSADMLAAIKPNTPRHSRISLRLRGNSWETVRAA